MRWLSRLLPPVTIAGILTSASEIQSEELLDITVHVSDATGARLLNARVVITPLVAKSWEPPNAVTLQTSSDGAVGTKLKPGTYNLSVSAPEFITSHQQIEVSKPISLNIKLGVASSYCPVVIQGPNLFPTSIQLRELIPEAAPNR
jgi:hypothetical protein